MPSVLEQLLAENARLRARLAARKARKPAPKRDSRSGPAGTTATPSPQTWLVPVPTFRCATCGRVFEVAGMRTNSERDGKAAGPPSYANRYGGATHCDECAERRFRRVNRRPAPPEAALARHVAGSVENEDIRANFQELNSKRY